jgi:hypothetical protein
MSTNLTMVPADFNRALQRSRGLANQAKELEARGDAAAAARCRRQAYALIELVAIGSGDQTRIPCQGLLERLLVTHERRQERAAA